MSCFTCTSSARSAFAKLDQGRKGYLVLSELIYAAKHSDELGLPSSLPFDAKHAGRLSLREFKAMVGHVRAITRFFSSTANGSSAAALLHAPAAIQERISHSRKLHEASSALPPEPSSLASRLAPSLALPAPAAALALETSPSLVDEPRSGRQERAFQPKKSIRARLTFDRSTDLHPLGDSASDQTKLFVPMFSRYSSNDEDLDCSGTDDSVGESSRSSRANTGLGSPTLASSQTPLPQRGDRGLSQRILHEPLNYLRQWLRSEEGREQFSSWLVRLVHYDRSPTISIPALEALVYCLAADGITISELGLRHGSASDTLSGAQTIAHAFSKTTDKEELTQGDFLQFSERVTAEYKTVPLQSLSTHKRIGVYTVFETIGYGSEGVVKRAQNCVSGELRAIKIIEKGNVAKMSKIDIQIKAMELLEHPNVVTLHQVLESEEHVFLILEYCQTSLYDIVHEQARPFDEATSQSYMHQLLTAVQYCHSKGVCHRDLRVENLLLGDSSVLKVTDFGHAGVFAEGWDLFSTTLVGSIQYITPEQIEGKCYSGQSLDMWACGIICYFLLTAQLPFDAGSRADNMHDFLSDVLAIKYAFPDNVSSGARDFIGRLLVREPHLRSTSSQALEHPWLSSEHVAESSST